MAYYLLLVFVVFVAAFIPVLAILLPEYNRKMDKAYALPGDYFIPGFEKESLAYSKIMDLHPFQVSKPKSPTAKRNRQRRVSAADVANGAPSKVYTKKTNRTSYK